MLSRKAALPFVEFVALMALMMSLVALSIDAMLPALSHIDRDLQLKHVNDSQLIVSFLFFGLALGQMFYGPLSDSFGRKPAVCIGISIFMLGCLLSVLATDFETMLLGRLLQGLGLAAPRTITVALIRDLYEGEAMARVMSFSMTVFIMVPMIAPALGQGVLLLFGWRAIFLAILTIGAMILCWFMLRQPETLPRPQRKKFSLLQVRHATREVLVHRVALGYTLASGFSFGAFLAYLSTVQQVLQQQYELGNWFPLVFACLAFSMGSAAYINGRLVMCLGMRLMVWRSLLLMCASSLVFYGIAGYFSGHPPLLVTMIYFAIVLFCTGILFGNMNALAMQPLGHIAGVGAAVVASFSLLISVPLGIAIARCYVGRVEPLVLGFACCGFVALVLVYWAQRPRG